MQGAIGAVTAADPRAGEDGARAAIDDIGIPLGVLQFLCVATTDEFDAWRPGFERIARGVTLPH